MCSNSHTSNVCLNFFIRSKEEKSDEEKSSDDSIIKNKSAFDPPRNRGKIVDQNIDSLNSLKQPFKPRMGYYKRFKKLQEYRKKEAGKGGYILIILKFHYNSMILSQLNDEKTYKRLN